MWEIQFPTVDSINYVLNYTVKLNSLHQVTSTAAHLRMTYLLMHFTPGFISLSSHELSQSGLGVLPE